MYNDGPGGGLAETPTAGKKSEAKVYYSLNNRRLFVFKFFCPNFPIPCVEVTDV